MTDFSTLSNLPDFQISEDSKTVLKDILQSKDKDRKGYVDIDELGDCLEAFGFDPDDEDLDFLKTHMDDNGDGRLEIEELLDNIEVINYHCWYGKALMDEFIYIDADKDNVIRFPEMLKVLTTRGEMPPIEARRLLDALARKFDANFDGKFSYPEFVKIYMSDLLPFKDQIQSGSFQPPPKPQTAQKVAAKKKKIKKKPSESSLNLPSSAKGPQRLTSGKESRNDPVKSGSRAVHLSSTATSSPKPRTAQPHYRPKTGSHAKTGGTNATTRTKSSTHKI